MSQSWAKGFYNSHAWKQCRGSYMSKRISIDGGLCETCHHELGWIVHHKTWLTPDNINNPMITLNHDNLKFDCQACHNAEKEGQEAEQPRYFFGERGEVILISPSKDED